MSCFEALALEPELLRAIDDLGYLRPTDVQDETIPLILGGGDVCVAAETGSGKTAAFSLPVLQLVHETLRQDFKASEEMDVQDLATVSFNIADKDGLMILGDGDLCESRSDAKWSGVRATRGIYAGKYYFEVMVGDGLCRVGWSMLNSNLELGKDDASYGYGGTGKKSHSSKFENYGGPYQGGDVIGCYLDLNDGIIGFSKNGMYLGDAFLLDRTTSARLTYYPAVTIKSGSCRGKFSNFSFPPRQAEFKSICESSLSSDSTSSIALSNPSTNTTQSPQSTPFCIILEPTKDLCEQVGQALASYKKYLINPEIHHCVLFGGSDCSRAELYRSHIIVGTPSKICESIRNSNISLTKVKFYILDEADGFVDVDNLALVLSIFDKLPKAEYGVNRLQVCFFSATLHSPEIISLSARICYNPTWVDLKGTDFVPTNIHQIVLSIDPKETSFLLDENNNNPFTDGVHVGSSESKKDRYSQLIKQLKHVLLLRLINSFSMSQCMIFCRTNVDCNNVERFLTAAGGGIKFRHGMEKGLENRYSCLVLAGMRSVDERQANLKAFKDGSVRFLICTDVAAKGIDIQGLPFVVNLTLPDVPTQYIHRIGRVGRAGALGLAISIVAADTYQERVWYHKCSDRGKSCAKRGLLEEGGCTMYYNEPECKKAIEKYLGFEMIEMGIDCVLPEVCRSSSGGLSGYGQLADDRPDEELCQQVQLHQDILLPSLERLKNLETVAQLSFLNRCHVLTTPPSMAIDNSLLPTPPQKKIASRSPLQRKADVSSEVKQIGSESKKKTNNNNNNNRKKTVTTNKAMNDDDDGGNLAGEKKIQQRQDRFNSKHKK